MKIKKISSIVKVFHVNEKMAAFNVGQDGDKCTTEQHGGRRQDSSTTRGSF